MEILGNVLEKVNGSGSTGNSVDNNLEKVLHWGLLVSIKNSSAVSVSTSPFWCLPGPNAGGMAVGMAECEAN